MAFPSTDHFSGATMPGHTSMGLEGCAKIWEWSYGHTRLNSWWRTMPPQRCISEVPFCFPPQKDWSSWLPPDKPVWHLLFSVASFIKTLPHTKNYYSAEAKGLAWKDTVFSFKECFPSQHFCHDTANRPDIHCSERKRREGGKRKKIKFKKKIRKAAVVAGAVTFAVACSKRWFKFHSHPLFFLCC